MCTVVTEVGLENFSDINVDALRSTITLVTWTKALETCDHRSEFKLMDGHVSVFFCVMFPYADTTYTG